MPQHSLQRRLAESWPPADWRDLTVLAAVSGGADSVGLLCGLAAIREHGPGRLVVAHFHHGLRGAAADEDAAFVQELAARLKLDCKVGFSILDFGFSIDGGDDSKVEGLPGGQSRSEESLRERRYGFLLETAHKLGARYVATAHTADDQAETVLHRILRGTGLAGLAGMPRARPLADGIALIRPLLDVRRAELREYLAEIGQPFREDQSNLDAGYTRNRIRLELLPRMAEEYNPRVVEALLRLGRLAGEQQDVMDELARSLRERSQVRPASSELAFDAAMLSAAPPVVAREALVAAWASQGWPRQAMTHEHWVELLELAHGRGGARRSFPGNIDAELTAGMLTLRDANAASGGRLPEGPAALDGP